MNSKKLWVAAGMIIAVALMANQAKAFYLTVPDRLITNWQNLQRQQVLGDTITGDQNQFPPCPSGQVYLCSGNTNPGPGMTCPTGQPTCGVLQNQNQPNQTNQPANQQQNQQNQPNQNNQQYQPWADMCSNNTALACVGSDGKFVASAKVGPDGKPVCPAGSTAKCGNYQQNNQNQQQNGQQGQMMNQNQGNYQQGPNNQGITRDLTQMTQNLERAAKVIGASDKITQARSLIADLKASLAGDATNFDNDKMDQLRQLMNDLQTDMQDAQHLADMKRQTASAAKGLANFEKQLAKLTKQKIAVPADLTAALAAAHSAINAINNAKTWDDNLPSDMQDAMQNLNDYEPTLNMLGQWPQTAKQITSQVKNLDKQLKNAATIKTKLAKSGVDITDTYNNFADAVAKMKAAAAQATGQISTDPQSAFDTLQNDFFGQMDDAMQFYNNIAVLSNLGSFNSQFNKNVSQLQSRLNSKSVKAADNYNDLKASLQEIKDEGAKIKNLIKARPLDIDAVSTELDAFGGMMTDLNNQLDDIQGTSTAMPWENQTGPQQFTAPTFNFNMPSSGNNNSGPQNNGGGQQQPQNNPNPNNYPAQ